MGNVRWLAPEIVCDGKKRSTASDVYAFGCLMLEIATGAVPYRGMLDIQVVLALMSGKTLATDRASYPELPDNDTLWELMSDCWKYECEARPTMKAVEARLQG
ncbi:hypothetical protein FRC03_011242 [Tulasnella sp. 419]|nr:hypothetical protein FRC03_011242 [Tulasnella sp. 419]